MIVAMIPLRFVLVFTTLCATTLVGQQRVEKSTMLPAGKVTITYAPTELRGREPETSLEMGDVWRMSAGWAAELKTDAPLMCGDATIPPGDYRMSARYQGPSNWRLLLFRGPTIFVPGTSSMVMPFEFASDEKAQETLAIDLTPDKNEFGLKLHWGTMSLSARFQALEVSSVEAKIGGKPSRFEFFHLPSTRSMHMRVATGERLLFGTWHHDGVRYDLYGEHDRNVMHLLMKNFTATDAKRGLKHTKQNYEQTLEYLKSNPDDAADVRAWADKTSDEIKELERLAERAAARPAKLQVRGNLVALREGSKALTCMAKTEDDAFSIHLTFGQRRAEFVVPHAQLMPKSE